MPCTKNCIKNRYTKNRYIKNQYVWPLIVSVICACAWPVSRGSTVRKEQECPTEQERGQKTPIIREKEGLITLTRQNDGQECRFRAGQMFQVMLPENPTSGYRWTVAEPAPSNITLIRQEYTARQHDPLFVGAGRVRTMTFQAVSAGSARLVCLLRRPWEAEGEYVDSFHVSLHIEE